MYFHMKLKKECAWVPVLAKESLRKSLRVKGFWGKGSKDIKGRGKGEWGRAGRKKIKGAASLLGWPELHRETLPLSSHALHQHGGSQSRCMSPAEQRGGEGGGTNLSILCLHSLSGQGLFFCVMLPRYSRKLLGKTGLRGLGWLSPGWWNCCGSYVTVRTNGDCAPGTGEAGLCGSSSGGWGSLANPDGQLCWSGRGCDFNN